MVAELWDGFRTDAVSARAIQLAAQRMRAFGGQGFDMKTTIMVSTVLLASMAAAANVPSPEVQIAAAVLAAPGELREGAAVLGYNPQGELVRLREAKNERLCPANDPRTSYFTSAC